MIKISIKSKSDRYLRMDGVYSNGFTLSASSEIIFKEKHRNTLHTTIKYYTSILCFRRILDANKQRYMQITI
jgi:hypothetical protein